jgi:hypothetical protein|tara:strand:- start:220 stop:597 length:378 start_codon:yes stop_codon:yes gene_type:complete
MTFLEITLPGSILILAFVLKLFIDRTATAPELIAAMFELPVDIAFLATTLVAAFIISDQSGAGRGLVAFVIYVIGAVVVVVLWRRSHSLFIADRLWPAFGLSIIGYGLCAFGLFHAVGLLSGVAK